MPRCDLENHPKACVITQSKYKRPGCRDCRIGEKHLLAGAPEPSAPAASPTETNPPTEKKEAAVATKGKEAILRRITNEKSCSRGRLTCFCSVTAAQLDAAVKELEAEGKIKSWEKGRGCLYTLPDAPDPREAAAPSKDATVPSKKPRSVNRKSATPPIKTRAKAKASMPAPRKAAGNGVYAAVFADLEARRTAALDQVEKFDRALETLRALA